MNYKSHIDPEKLYKVANGHKFEYKDVVSEDLPDTEHADGGAAFKEEVENGVYDGVVVSDPDATHVTYKKK